MTRFVLICAALALAACGAEGERPGLIVLPGMVTSVPVDSYDADPRLSDGSRLASAPEGTVAFGAPYFGFGPGPEDALLAGQTVHRPGPPTPETLARGEVLFGRFCAVCHGPAGQGDGPIIGAFPNPPNLESNHSKSLPDGQLFHIITYGQGIMAPYGAQVRHEERWALVAYLRTLQGYPEGMAPEVQIVDVTPVEELPPDLEAPVDGEVPEAVETPEDPTLAPSDPEVTPEAPPPVLPETTLDAPASPEEATP